MEISPFGVKSAINNLQWRMECIINIPASIEDKLVQYAKRMRMRRTQGEYPFVRFSRRLLN